MTITERRSIACSWIMLTGVRMQRGEETRDSKEEKNLYQAWSVSMSFACSLHNRWARLFVPGPTFICLPHPDLGGRINQQTARWLPGRTLEPD